MLTFVIDQPGAVHKMQVLASICKIVLICIFGLICGYLNYDG